MFFYDLSGNPNTDELKALIKPAFFTLLKRAGRLSFKAEEFDELDNYDFGWDRDPETGDIDFWAKPCDKTACGEAPR